MKLWKVEIATQGSMGVYERCRGCAKDATSAGEKAMKIALKTADKDMTLYVESVVCLGDKDF